MVSFDERVHTSPGPSKSFKNLQQDMSMTSIELQAESLSQQPAASQTLYMPIDSPPTPAPSPVPNIMTLVHGDQSSVISTPIPPFILPQNPVLRRQYLHALLYTCTPTELLFISTTIAPLLKRDFLRDLPTELALQVLGYVDEPKTLARASQVSRWWRKLAGDQALWRRMCVQYGFKDPSAVFRGFSGKGKAKNQFVEDEECMDEEIALTPLHTRSTLHPAVNLPPDTSFREHFKYSYSIMKNWHTGGHLLRAHKVAASSITTQDSGVVTSLALDEDWVVVGLANCRIHVFSARTGVLARTLVGHDSGVWAVCLVHKGGYMGGPDRVEPDRNGKRRRRRKDPVGVDEEDPIPETSRSRPDPRSRYSEGDLETLSSTFQEWSCSPYTTSVTTSGGTDVDPPLHQFLPASLRIALGLSADADDDMDTDLEQFKGDEETSHWDSRSGVLDEDAEPSEMDTVKMGRSPGKPSNVSGSSEGWGQPGALVVSGGCDKVVRVWDIRSGYCIYILRGHTSTIRCIKVLHNRPIAVSGSRDHTLRVWDVQRGRLLRTLAGHSASVRCLDVCGNRVVSGSYDYTCRLWDVDTGECIYVLQGHLQQIYSVAFDGTWIASGGLDTTVRLWDAETGECKASLQGHTALVCQLQLSHTILATGGSDGRVIMFSLPPSPRHHSRSSSNRSTQASNASGSQVLHRIAAHDSSVTALQFDQRFLVTGGNDGRVRLYETQTGNYVRELSEPSDCVWKVAYGPGAEVCAIVCRRQGKTIMEIWSLKPMEEKEAEGEGDRMRTEEEERMRMEPVLDC
ncbi:WD40-repeat-containing domain protein [Rhodocollybia butyracea]|uniref:WD40-repeat-containing domain protein n=1 Tax=Rhodocollybia butyracea TaxID=206335 RepID=A0A9P5PQV8_9AGAR|nr:WD40-repeat-containing domain protein [Rhodocollybia butyracea]